MIELKATEAFCCSRGIGLRLVALVAVLDTGALTSLSAPTFNSYAQPDLSYSCGLRSPFMRVSTTRATGNDVEFALSSHHEVLVWRKTPGSQSRA